jgi:glucosamine--fructose-6-phosphate aminotransferase (isomerizing)
MCGIFGVVCTGDRRELARELALALLRYSETRGREAVGMAIHDGTRIEVLKQGGSVTDFLASPKLAEMLAPRGGRTLAITGHSRLATNGTQSNVDNNQPVITRGAVALHNGIVVNDRALVARYPALAPQSELDSEVLAALLRTKLDATGDLVAATRATFAEIEGSASIAMLFDNLDVMLLATNTGSLFQLTSHDGELLAFASERFILQRVLEDSRFTAALGDAQLEQVRAGHALAVSLDNMQRRAFSLAPDRSEPPFDASPNGHHVEIVDRSSRADRLRRCTKCILPET